MVNSTFDEIREYEEHDGKHAQHKNLDDLDDSQEPATVSPTIQHSRDLCISKFPRLGWQ